MSKTHDGETREERKRTETQRNGALLMRMRLSLSISVSVQKHEKKVTSEKATQQLT